MAKIPKVFITSVTTISSVVTTVTNSASYGAETGGAITPLSPFLSLSPTVPGASVDASTSSSATSTPVMAVVVMQRALSIQPIKVRSTGSAAQSSSAADYISVYATAIISPSTTTPSASSALVLEKSSLSILPTPSIPPSLLSAPTSLSTLLTLKLSATPTTPAATLLPAVSSSSTPLSTPLPTQACTAPSNSTTSTNSTTSPSLPPQFFAQASEALDSSPDIEATTIATTLAISIPLIIVTIIAMMCILYRTGSDGGFVTRRNSRKLAEHEKGINWDEVDGVVGKKGWYLGRGRSESGSGSGDGDGDGSGKTHGGGVVVWERVQVEKFDPARGCEC